MRITLCLCCIGLLFSTEMRGAPANVKITGFSTVDGESVASFEVRKPGGTVSEFVTLKPGESRGDLTLISCDSVHGEAKIKQGDSTITLSFQRGIVKEPSTNAPVPEARLVRTPLAKLNGIAFANGRHVAFFEIPNTNAKNPPQYIHLEQGERDGRLEFVGFDPGTGQVKIREKGQERSFSWTSGNDTIHFQNAPVAQVLDLFRRWKKKGWAAASSVLGIRISVHVGGDQSTETALDLVTKACREKGVILMEAGEKLILGSQRT